MFGQRLMGHGSWLAVLLLAAIAMAAEPQVKPNSEVLFIEEVLEQPADFELSDMDLPEFVALIKQRYHIPVVLDSASLAEEGIAADTKISCHLKGVALRSAISWALAAQSMDWTVQDEVLLLTTRDVVDSTMSTMVHDVSDFIKGRGEKEEADAVQKRLAELAEVVESTVTPGSWKAADGDATLRPLEVGGARVLVVYHNRRGQEAVAMVLDDLAYCSEEPTPGSPKRPSGSAAKVTSLRRPIRSR